MNIVKWFISKIKIERKPENIQCPVCGFYCLGIGGKGCIDKPVIFNESKKTNQ